MSDDDKVTRRVIKVSSWLDGYDNWCQNNSWLLFLFLSEKKVGKISAEINLWIIWKMKSCNFIFSFSLKKKISETYKLSFAYHLCQAYTARGSIPMANTLHTCGFSRLFFNKRSEISNTVYTHLLLALCSWMRRMPVCWRSSWSWKFYS